MNIMNKKLIKAPIDNKNVCEDFTDVFHGGEFVEQTSNSLHRQLFYMGGIPFEIRYFFGENIFRIESLCNVGKMSFAPKVREALNDLNGGNIICKYDECYNGKAYVLNGEFYFKEEEELL